MTSAPEYDIIYIYTKGKKTTQIAKAKKIEKSVDLNSWMWYNYYRKEKKRSQKLQQKSFQKVLTFTSNCDIIYMTDKKVKNK